MTSEEMFFSYRMFNPDVPDYGQCIFPSGMVEQMIQEGNGRIAVGQDFFELYNEEPPLVGEIQALEDEGGRCLCLIRIDDISITPGKHIASDVPCFPQRIDERLYCVMGFSVVFR